MLRQPTESSEAHASAPIREGEIVAGKYRVTGVLGMGGMGVVAEAHHLQLDEKVTIKFLLPEIQRHPETVDRFVREARAAIKIKSEHVARVLDVGSLKNGAPYTVMEYLEGSDLATWLSQHGVPQLAQAVELILQACEVIAEAHALGIVHRDLKPTNLFVVRRPDGYLSVKVVDFGISAVAGLTPGAGLTEAKPDSSTSGLTGTPPYMSFEQLRSPKDVDARSDIWALGAILYELVTGVPPYSADTISELILQICTTTPRPIRDRRPDVPDDLVAVILKCLRHDRSERFQSVGELAIALERFAPESARASTERISGTVRASGGPASSRSWDRSVSVAAPRSSPMIGLPLFLFLLALVLGGYAVYVLRSAHEAATRTNQQKAVDTLPP